MTDESTWENDGGHDDDGRSVSVWMSNTDARRFPPLGESREADVCIVGAGIAGLSTAYLAAREGLSVVVLDDGSLGGGQSKRTTGHLSSVIDDHYLEIERVHGSEGARVAAASHAAAIDCIEEIVGALGIDCDFQRLDGDLCLAPNRTPDWLDKELEAAHRAGLTDAERLDACPGSDRFAGPCLRFPRQAQFHPLRYLAGLAAGAERHGARLFASHVVEVASESGGRLQVTTASAARVTARFVVVATNSPIQ